MSELNVLPNKKFNGLVTTWSRIFQATHPRVITTANERDVIIPGDKYDNRVFDEYEIYHRGTGVRRTLFFFFFSLLFSSCERRTILLIRVARARRRTRFL